MAVGWSPAGSKSETILNAMPPSDFSGRAGRCGVHSCAVLVQRIAALDQRRQRLDRRGDAANWQRAGLFQRRRRGRRPGSGRRRRAPSPTPRRPSRCRAPLRVGAAERSGMLLVGFGDLPPVHPRGRGGALRSPPPWKSPRPNRRSSPTAAYLKARAAALSAESAPVQRFRRVEIIGQRAAAPTRFPSLRLLRRRLLFGCSGHRPNMGGVRRMKRPHMHRVTVGPCS